MRLLEFTKFKLVVNTDFVNSNPKNVKIDFNP